MIARRGPDRRRLSVWAGAVVIALVVAAVLGVLGWRARVQPDAPDRTTAQAAATAVRALMTFAPSDTAADRAKVAENLTGVLAADYALKGPDTVFPSALASKVSMTADVTDAATVTRGDRSARVLVFANQQIVVDGREDAASDVGVARWAWMTLVDGRWLLAKLEPVTPQ